MKFDDDFLRKRLVIGDPREEYELVATVAEDANLVRIERYYHSPGEVPCARACCRQPHNRGAVIKLASGEFAAIGHVCGSGLFPDEWDERASAYQQEIDLQRLLRRKLRFLSTKDELLAALVRLRDPMRVTDRLRKAWREGMPLLFEQVANAARRNRGQLQVEETPSATFREAVGEAARLAGRRSPAPTMLTTVHVLSGARMFDIRSPGKLLDEVIEAVKETADRMQEEGLTNRKLSNLLVNVSDLARKFEDAVIVHNAVRPALSERNLRGIARWAARGGLPGDYSVSGAVLRHRLDEYHHETSVTLPGGYGEVDPQEVRGLLGRALPDEDS